MEKVLVYGANKYLVQKAQEYGYYVIYCDENRVEEVSAVADKFIYVKYKDFEWNLQMAKEQGIVGVICGTEFSVTLCAYLSEQLHFPGNSVESAILCKNKYEYTKMMDEHNITNVPQYFSISSPDELKAIKDKIEFPVILKPTDNGGSVFTYRIDNYEDLEDKIEEVIAGSKNNIAFIETFIEGDEYSVETFVYKGKTHLLTITRRDMTELPYRVTLGHNLPSGLSREVEDKIYTAVSNLIHYLGVTQSAVNFDIIIPRGTDKIYIIDVNARVGGNGIATHIVPLSTGIDHIGNIVKVSLGLDGIDLEPKFHKAVYLRVLNLDEGVIQRMPSIDKYLDDEVVAIDFAKAVGDKCDKFISLAQRAGLIVACGEDVEHLKERANEVRDLINEEVFRP